MMDQRREISREHYCCGLPSDHPILFLVAAAALCCSTVLVPRWDHARADDAMARLRLQMGSSTARYQTDVRHMHHFKNKDQKDPTVVREQRPSLQKLKPVENHRNMTSVDMNSVVSARHSHHLGTGSVQNSADRGRHKVIKRKRHRREPPSASIETVLRLKAVRSFLDEVDKAERRAASEAMNSRSDHRTTSSRKKPTSDAGLVLTRKLSGRMQTGCVGGCFR